MRNRIVSGAWRAWVTLLLLAGGCERVDGTRSVPAALDKETLRTEAVRGPVRVAVEAAPLPVRLSDEPKLTVTIEYETGVEIEKPPFGDAVGDFVVRDFRESLPEVRGNREVIRQVYVLEPTRTGPAQIDPILISFTDRRPQGDGKRHRLETEALTLDVTSMVGGSAPSLKDLKGFDNPMALPEPGVPAGWWAFGVAVAVAVGAAVLAYVRRRRGPLAASVLSPREQATRELHGLWDSEIARRDVKRFYVELTDIVRRYIERSTGIRAPEQTTEEFLREVGRGEVFSRDERQRLKDFLESADLVKFAAYRPDSKDVDEAYRRAGRFVGTAEGEVAAA
jgi:hypothetical protein